jgi:hypothetical protein
LNSASSTYNSFFGWLLAGLAIYEVLKRKPFNHSSVAGHSC